MPRQNWIITMVWKHVSLASLAELHRFLHFVETLSWHFLHAAKRCRKFGSEVHDSISPWVTNFAPHHCYCECHFSTPSMKSTCYSFVTTIWHFVPFYQLEEHLVNWEFPIQLFECNYWGWTIALHRNGIVRNLHREYVSIIFSCTNTHSHTHSASTNWIRV